MGWELETEHAVGPMEAMEVMEQLEQPEVMGALQLEGLDLALRERLLLEEEMALDDLVSLRCWAVLQQQLWKQEQQAELERDHWRE